MMHSEALKHKDEIFDFFYYFSRFEFALKNNSFCYSGPKNSCVMPAWNDFVEANKKDYEPSNEAKELIELQPRFFKFVSDENKDWVNIEHKEDASMLKKVVDCLRTVRNNLFHGGKLSNEKSAIERDLYLISLGEKVLHQLSNLDSNVRKDFRSDY